MSDIPIIERRGQAPASPSTFDIPILMKRGLLPGPGLNVEYQFKRERCGTFQDEEEKNAAADMATTKWVAEVLHAHYRGHFWAVATDSKQGCVLITIPILLGNWKYLLRLKDLTPAKVIKCGGEILERFNLPRSRIDIPTFVEARTRRVSRASERPPGS